MSVRQYTPKHKKWDRLDHLTPNIEKNEGIRPFLGTTVAPYLPLARYNVYDEDYFVLSTGKVAALDTAGFIVPAGLKIDMDAAIGAGNVTAAEIEYSATDVLEGVLNSNGVAATEGEKVVASMLSIHSGVTGATGLDTRPLVGARDNSVSFPIGIVPYSYYRAASDALVPWGATAAYSVWSPTQLRYHNYNKQGRVTVLCDYVCEYPICSVYNPTFAGVAAYVGATPRPGAFLTYDIDSNLALADPSTVIFPAIVAQVIRVELNFPRNLLQRVKTRYDGTEGPQFSDLDKMPGSATGGLPDRMTYAHTTVGTILVNLITR